MSFTDDEYKKIDAYIEKDKKIQSQTDWVEINNEKRIESIVHLIDGNFIDINFSFRGSVNKNALTLDNTRGELKLLYSAKSKKSYGFLALVIILQKIILIVNLKILIGH